MSEWLRRSNHRRETQKTLARLFEEAAASLLSRFKLNPVVSVSWNDCRNISISLIDLETWVLCAMAS